MEIPRPFRRLSYEEAMNQYGTDRPDLRFGLPMVGPDSPGQEFEVKVFAEAAQKGGCVKAIRVPGGAAFSRKELDDLVALAQELGGQRIGLGQDQPRGLAIPSGQIFDRGRTKGHRSGPGSPSRET